MNEQQTGREKMTDNIEQYKNCLDGLTKDMPEEFFKLAQVFELSVFEPIHMEGKKDIYAAYLMNDAVESYFVFEQSVMTGSYKELECEQTASIVHDDNGYMLIVNQSGENRFTIRFTNLHMQTTCFDYGCMGHFWVKGYEYLRILEYRLAILNDKCEYLGEEAASDTERKLAKLVHFPPLNYTCYPAVPAKYIVPMEDPWNPTEEAMDVMEELVKEAGDKSLLWWLQRYRRYHGKRMSRWIARLLHREKHAAVVDLLNKKLAKEAENYPRRDFGEKFNQKYQNILKKAEKRKAELESNGQKVTLVREEPFAAARDSVDFKVYLMIWKEKQGDRVAEIEEF